VLVGWVWQTDIDKSGEIEYGEFLAATMHLSKIDQQENLLKAFNHFDADGSGNITLDELQKACEELKLSKEEIESMIQEVDQNNVSARPRPAPAQTPACCAPLSVCQGGAGGPC